MKPKQPEKNFELLAWTNELQTRESSTITQGTHRHCEKIRNSILRSLKRSNFTAKPRLATMEVTSKKSKEVIVLYLRRIPETEYRRK